MIKRSFLGLAIFLNCLLSFKAGAQTVAFHKPYEYKLTWQRLLLQLSSTYFTVVTENQTDLDSSLIYASNCLGLSRVPMIAEGFNDPDLTDHSKWIDKKDPESARALLLRSTGNTHLELLILLGAYYAFQPDSYHHYKDSILYFLNKAIKESEVLHQPNLGRQARLLIGKMYVQAYDFQHGDPVFDHLVTECSTAGDIMTEAKVLYYRGLYTAFTPFTTSKRIAYLQQARQLYHHQKNTEGEINTLTDICYLNVASYQLDNAYKTSLEALNLAESINFPYTHYNTDAIAMVTVFEGKFGEPLKYALQTVKTAEATRDSIGLGYFYSRLGILYLNENVRREEARKWEEKAVYSLMRGGGSNGLYASVNNLGMLLITDHRVNEAWDIILKVSKKVPPKSLFDKLFFDLVVAECHIQFKQYDAGQRYLEMADSIEQLREKTGPVYRRALVTMGFGELYYLKGDYAKAKIFLERYLTYRFRAEATLDNELRVLDKLINIDLVLHDQASEIHHLLLQKQLADSNYRVSTLRQAEELQVKYATAEKVNQITLLNKEAGLERANLNKATLEKNVTIAGIILVLIIAGLLYRQNAIRKKNNLIVSHKNELLQRLVTEKEWLLKEVHHRVKNNLHSVISLLEAQAAYLENDALQAIENSQHRIYAMSLIHQKLYQSDDIKTIDMTTYIPELVQYLRDSFDTNHIHFRLMIDPIQLNASQAIPLGLIINEALTNSIKYAFPNSRRGEISISLTGNGTKYKLELTDNGIGLPGKVTGDQKNSLGLELMTGLVKEIRGNIIFEYDNGVKITVLFEDDLLPDIDQSHIDYFASV